MRSLEVNNITLCDLIPRITQAKLECEKYNFLKKVIFLYKFYKIYKEILDYINTAPFFKLLEDFSNYIIVYKESDSSIKVGYYKAFILGEKVGCISIINNSKSYLATYTIKKDKSISSTKLGYHDFDFVTRHSLEDISYNVALINTNNFPEDINMPKTKIAYDDFNEELRIFIKKYIKEYLYTVEV